MLYEHYFYNCSKEYIASIDLGLFNDITETVEGIPKLDTQSEINQHIFLSLTSKGWSFDTYPSGIKSTEQGEKDIRDKSKRSLCLTSSTLGANWHADFAKSFGGKLVQIEAQFGKVESMFKDFCGFSIAYYEKRLALGIEIVLCEPTKYFSHRKASIGGMAYFDIAKRTLPAIGLNCPIWLLGLRE